MNRNSSQIEIAMHSYSYKYRCDEFLLKKRNSCCYYIATLTFSHSESTCALNSALEVQTALALW